MSNEDQDGIYINRLPVTPQDPVATSLLNLPNEIVGRIAWCLAPHGGRKASALRLTSHRLNRAVAHVVWASICVRVQGSHHDELWAELLMSDLGHADSVRSIRLELGGEPELAQLMLQVAVLRKLKGMTRLEIAGRLEKVGADIEGVPFPRKLSSSLRHLGALRTLCLRELDVVGDINPAKWLPPNLHAFEIHDCSGVDDLFKAYSNEIDWVPATTPEVLRIGRMHGPKTIRMWDTGMLALWAAASSPTKDVEVYWFQPGPSTGSFANQLDLIPAEELHIESLRIAGIHQVLRLEDVLGTAVVVQVLHSLARGPLTKLDLPVYGAFKCTTPIMALRLPSILFLGFTSYPATIPFVMRPDIYTSAHSNLTTLLASAFPNIKSLSLKGFFDTTGVRHLAFATPQQLAREYPDITALLCYLRWTSVVELRLEDSDGHPHGRECRFERVNVDTADWKARVVAY